jgi:large subunit ribosomal protein L10
MVPFIAPASQVARLAQALADKRAEEGGAAPAEAVTESDTAS